MKIVFLSLIVTCAFMACNQSKHNGTIQAGNASTPVNIANAPVMKFNSVSYDFGKIKQGVKVIHTFKFINTGKSPLIIIEATASCGCTKPECPLMPVEPWKEGRIKVTFDSVGKTGLQDKVITITANTNPAKNIVHLIGEIFY